MTGGLKTALNTELSAADLLSAAAAAAVVLYLYLAASGLDLPLRQASFKPGLSYFDWGGHTIFSPAGSMSWALVMPAYLLSAAAAGYLLFFSWLLPRGAALRYGPLLAPLAFIPGYFACAAANRLITLALPNFLAAPALAAAYALVLVLGARRYLLDGGRFFTPAALAAAGLYAFYLVDGLQKGGSHVVGDGAVFFLNLITSGQGFAPAAHFPLFSQHYDEIMFLYPLYPLLRGAGKINIYLPFLMLYAAGKCAAALAVYFLTRRLSGGALFSFFLTAFVFLGNPFLSPLVGVLIFDSGSAVNHILHIGRVFGILIPFILPALLLEAPPASAPGRARLGSFALAGAGLAASTLSNLYAPLAALFCGLLLKIKSRFPGLAARPVLFRGAFYGAFGLTALAPLLIAGPMPLLRQAGGLALALGAVCCGCVLLLSQFSPAKAEPAFFKKIPAAVCLGYAVGIVLLGNLFLPATLGAFGNFEMLQKGVANPLAGPLLKMFGPTRYTGVFPLDQLAGTAHYLWRFGLMYAVLLLGLAASARRLLSPERPASAADLLPAAVGLFALTGTFLYEYTNAAISGVNNHWPIWFKSRLLEPWYYGAILLCAGYAFRHCGRRLRWFLTAWPAGALLIEFIYNYGSGAVKPQFLLNLGEAGKVLRLF
jgi:hypothetical protein